MLLHFYYGPIVVLPAGGNLNNAQNLQKFLTNREKVSFGTRYAVVKKLDDAFSRIGGRDNRWVALLEGLKLNKPEDFEPPAPTPEINKKINGRLESGMTDLAQWIGEHPALTDKAWALVIGASAVIEVPRLDKVDDEALVRIDQELTDLVRAKNHVPSKRLKELLESLFAMKPGDPLVHRCILQVLTLMQQKSPWLIWGYQREMITLLPQLIRRVWSRADHDTRLELITRLAHLEVKGFFGLDRTELLYLWQDILSETPQHPFSEIAETAIPLAHYDAGLGENNSLRMWRGVRDSYKEFFSGALDMVLHPVESLEAFKEFCVWVQKDIGHYWNKGFFGKVVVLTSPLWVTVSIALVIVFAPLLITGLGIGALLLGSGKQAILRRHLKEVVERLQLPLFGRSTITLPRK